MTAISVEHLTKQYDLSDERGNLTLDTIQVHQRYPYHKVVVIPWVIRVYPNLR